ncbi:23S rRNA (guanine(745)-N(1))-methyltransferase [Thalassotalea atypica]|uniref:23S rRNA (guanine(745)-N(1))-methyltransferase n=1 Tax=Thalassotalea atypica TaxID=2054316 RepID=UPI0025727B4E|nr:23S rRNA (guanine(745)-N(1))-methyltransferase [Thalassotalea atypica]
MTDSPEYICPLCEAPLSPSHGALRCTNNHSFDIAKEGYVNLLPVQFKHSKNPGDNKAMVNARREFLEKGFYQPLVERLAALQMEFADNNLPTLDAGCGEGYYTHQQMHSSAVYGVDIAKEAIKKAAKKYRQCDFSVGTLSQLPFTSEFFGWIVSIYAPILEIEFSRVLSQGGYLLTVTPAEQHLYELKSLIYQQAQTHDVEKCPVENLTLVHQEQLSYPMMIESGQDTLNLLSMTPFAFKASKEVKQQIAKTAKFTCQADFLIRLFKKEN